MGTVIEDVKAAAQVGADALESLGYRADYSIESLKDVDRFFDEHSDAGEAKEGGELAENLGQKIFAVGAYVGEVVCRTYSGEWHCDDSDPEAAFNLAVQFPDGRVIWPIQRAMKRFKNGREDGIYVYARLVSPQQDARPSPNKEQPWWKFW